MEEELVRLAYQGEKWVMLGCWQNGCSTCGGLPTEMRKPNWEVSCGQLFTHRGEKWMLQSVSKMDRTVRGDNCQNENRGWGSVGSLFTEMCVWGGRGEGEVIIMVCPPSWAVHVAKWWTEVVCHLWGVVHWGEKIVTKCWQNQEVDWVDYLATKVRMCWQNQEVRWIDY